MSRPPRGLRGALRRGGLVLLGVLAGLGLAEGAARLLPPPRTHEAPLQLDRELGFRGVPGTRIALEDERGPFAFTLGREGFRGRELPAGPGTARRVVFLGDSFLVGMGLREEELVTARVERALGEGEGDLEVYNLSTVDTGTGQQLLLLALHQERLAPTEVVLVLYPPNDLVNDTRALAGRTQVSAGDAVRPYVHPAGQELRRSWVHPVRGPLRSRSALFAWVERALFSFRLEAERPSLPMAARVESGGLPLEELEVFRRHDPGAAWEQGWLRSFELLRALRERCSALGARLLVLVVPSEHQVQRGAKVVAWDLATRWLAGAPLDAVLDWNLPERRLARFFREQEIEARLLLEPLRAAVAEGRRVYARDGHLSSDGHALAAAPVAEWLAGRGSDAAPEPPTGRPVRLLPAAAEAPLVLDFRAGPHEAYLGDGWLGWGAESGGWRVADRALVVLPAGAGAFFVEGTVPQTARLPLRARLERAGVSSEQFELVEAGPFRLQMKSGGAPGEPTSDGYAVFVLDPDPGPGSAASTLRVERLGLAPVGPIGAAGGGRE